jgi:isopentenyl-diphosphate delta-isomerase
MNDPSEELVDIVNELNEVIGTAKRGEAHKKGHIHRALSVLIIHSEGKVLLQQRSKHTKVHPLSWDLSTSEHVLKGESYEDAGKRSVKEELGIEVEVKPISKTSLQKRKYEFSDKRSLRPDGFKTIYENEIVMMLSSMHDGPFKVDPVEVNMVEFFSIDEIEKKIQKGDKFTPWFLDEWENVKKYLITTVQSGGKG